MSRCHTYQGVHIPGCWGCAIYGDERHNRDRCTCPRPEPSMRTVVDELRATRSELQVTAARLDQVAALVDWGGCACLEPVGDG